MKCPYCDENIDDSVKVCPICGEKISIYARVLNTVKKAPMNVKKGNVSFCSKKKFVILCLSIIVLVACAFASYAGFEAYSTYINDPTYGSIVAHEDYEYYNYPDSAINVLNKVIDQNNDLIALINSRVPKKKKKMVFNTYLSNIDFYSIVLGNKISNGDFEGIEFNSEYQLPKAPMFKGEWWEGHFLLWLNYDYLGKTFTSHLGQDWQDYLKIAQETDSIKRLYDDTWLNRKLNLLISTDSFLSKYPNFERINEIKPLEMVTEILAQYSYGDIPVPVLQKDFEAYFKKADPTTESYKYLKQGYEIMKKNEFNADDDEIRELIKSISN